DGESTRPAASRHARTPLHGVARCEWTFLQAPRATPLIRVLRRPMVGRRKEDDMPANIIPTMRYHDAPAAIDWLCRAFGFSKQMVVPGDHGTIAHAQLTLGDGMIMLGSARDDAF